MRSKKRREYFFLYTGIFALMAVAVYGTQFWMHGKTFVILGDGFDQHYRALMYYGTWLRSIIKTLFSQHRLVLPEWDFSIGYGANAITTFHYYAFGDPLALLSVVVPAKYTAYLYSFLVVLRSYLAGLSFSYYCFYMKRENHLGILAGAFTYIFCFYAVRRGIWHPFFTNPMIYLPLLLIGVEKIFRKEKPYLFIFMVFLSAVSNFYFFYMLVLVTVFYVIVRCWGNACEADRGKRLSYVLRMIAMIGFYSVVGLMIAAALFLPVVRAFFNDYRSSVSSAVPLWYTDDYYAHLLAAFAWAVPLTEGQVFLGYGAPALVAVILLFAGKRRKCHSVQLKIFFAAGTLMLIFPAASYVLNGFSYAAARWLWAYAFLVAFLLAEMWDDFFAVESRDLLLLAVLILLYIYFNHSYASMRFASAALIAVLAVLAAGRFSVGRLWGVRLWQQGLLALTLICVAWNTHYMLDCKPDHQINDYMEKQYIDEKFADNPDAAVLALSKEEDFSRTFGDAVQMNSAPNSKAHNVQFYWSLSNKNIAQFFLDLGIRDTRFYKYSGQDDRIGLASLASCRYFVCEKKKQENVPYGFQLVKKKKKYRIYENEFALPLAYTYDTCLTEEQFEKLEMPQREETMLQSVVLDEKSDIISQNKDPLFSGSRINYELVNENEYLTEENNHFTATERDTQVTLKLRENGKGGNIYVYISGLDYKGKTSRSDVIFGMTAADGTYREKWIDYHNADNIRPSGQSDYLINLGYSETIPEKITLGFSKRGEYFFDAISVWRQPVEPFEESIRERRADAWEDEEIGVDTVSGRIALSEDKILVLSIPYDGGWSAFVDGKKQELLRANLMYSGLELHAGEHEIKLVYHTPGLRLGILLSVLGLVLFAGVAVCQRRRKMY